MILLGVTGTDGAGKGTLVEYLVREKGFTHYSARAIWVAGLEKRGVEPTRANMRLVANEMREAYGNDFLVTHYLKKVEEEKPEHAVIESIRTTAEAQTLKKHGGILIAIDAGQEVRYGRVQKRRSSSDQVTFEQFVEHEALEANDPNPHGMQKQKVIAMADYTIENDTSVSVLQTKIDEVLSRIKL